MQPSVIFINSHPIQYFAPLYEYLHQKGLSIEVWYCSDETIQGYKDRQFGTFVKWDVPLLAGYPYRFFTNRSFRPSIYGGFWGLFNPGLFRRMFLIPKSTIIVHGWGYSTLALAMIIGWFRGHRICLRGETPFNQESRKGAMLRLGKRIVLKGLLFRFVNRFLFIGTQNKLFYESMGVRPSRMNFTPYAVDNSRFQSAARQWSGNRIQFRANLELREDTRIFLFVGKFIEKKRPMDVVKAFMDLNDDNYALIMVGDGELRGEMEKAVSGSRTRNVFFPGFKNQTELAMYYAASDVFILPSGMGETWGLVVNEAMNFDLALIVSDLSGCATDLVMHGQNGFTYESGNVAQLTTCMRESSKLDGSLGSIKLKEYSFDKIFQTLETI